MNDLISISFFLFFAVSVGYTQIHRENVVETLRKSGYAKIQLGSSELSTLECSNEFSFQNTFSAVKANEQKIGIVCSGWLSNYRIFIESPQLTENSK